MCPDPESLPNVQLTYMNFNRREVLRGMGAVLALSSLPANAEQGHNAIEYFPSSLTRALLEKQKRDSIDSLAKSIPQQKEADYLRLYIPYLPEESRMYIPNQIELKELLQKTAEPMNDLSQAIRVGSYGVFVFADVNTNHTRKQRLYVLKRTKNHTVLFEKAYKISVAEEGFGNAKDSSQTPVGIHTIREKELGMFGEVVSARQKPKENPRLFKKMIINGKEHWFVKSFGRESGNELAEVVTDQYLLVGPETPASRGIRIHGTNRSGSIAEDGSWLSHLDGETLTGACIRMSNVDVRNLSKYMGISTPVMIYATPEAREEAAARNKPVNHHNVRNGYRPGEWVPPQE